MNYKVGYRIDEDAAHGIKQGYRIIAAFDYVVNAQDFIEKCIPAENQDRFFMLSNNTRYYPATGNFEIFYPKRSKIGASAAGWSPGSDDGRPERKNMNNYIKVII